MPSRKILEGILEWWYFGCLLILTNKLGGENKTDFEQLCNFIFPITVGIHTKHYAYFLLSSLIDYSIIVHYNTPSLFPSDKQFERIV